MDYKIRVLLLATIATNISWERLNLFERRLKESLCIPIETALCRCRRQLYVNVETQDDETYEYKYEFMYKDAEHLCVRTAMIPFNSIRYTSL